MVAKIVKGNKDASITKPTDHTTVNSTSAVDNDTKVIEPIKTPELVKTPEPTKVAKPVKTTEGTKEVIYFSARNRKYAFLTNEYSSELTIDGKEYWHVEGYYQSQKFAGINLKAEDHIRTAFSPTSCRKVSTTYRVTPEREELWNDELQDIVMMKGLLTKFITNSKLAKLLIDTGDKRLLYANTTDEYWGTGSEGKGANELGVCLMKVRDTIKQVYLED